MIPGDTSVLDSISNHGDPGLDIALLLVSQKTDLLKAQSTARELEQCLAEFPEGNGDAGQLYDRLTQELRALGFGVLADFEHLIDTYQAKSAAKQQDSNALYCYSLSIDGDEYQGQFSNLDEALKAAARDKSEEWHFDGFPITVWIGEVVFPGVFLEGQGLHFASGVVEKAAEMIDDEMTTDDETISLSRQNEADLGDLIEKFLLEHGDFVDTYAVQNPVEYTVLNLEGEHQ